MSGSLNLISSVSVSSATATVTLTGIDSTYDVYRIIGSNLRPDIAGILEARVTKSGSAQTDSEYDVAMLGIYTGGSYVNEGDANRDSFYIYNTYEETTATGRGNGLDIWLFNFPNASENSFFTIEQSYSH